jgi:hypothetical protein
MKLWKALLYVPLLLLSQNSNAGIGKVTEQVNTPPSIQRANSTIPGTKGTGVEMNDAIKTQQGKVGITFEDDTKVQVNENSKLVIDDFVYDPKSKAGKLGAKIALGTVRYASGQIAKNSPQNVALNTPSATVAVRGTDFTATVDELGESTIILLPSCPNDRPNRTVKDIESNCKTGSIEVSNDVGTVILNQPFQVTKVQSRTQPPTPPKVLNLSEMAINNMLIVSPPKEVKQAVQEQQRMFNPLDIDFLKEKGLENWLDMQANIIYQDKLAKNFLDNGFLDSLFDIVGNELDQKFLEPVDPVLPDYKKASGIVAYKDEMNVELCRDNGSDIQCVKTPLTQNSTIYQTQGSLEFKNRINSGGNTIITLIQR